jgi:hypothetical protein
LNLTVSQKGAVLVVPLLFQLGFVLAVVLFQRDHAETGQWAVYTKEVIAQALEVQVPREDAQS